MIVVAILWAAGSLSVNLAAVAPAIRALIAHILPMATVPIITTVAVIEA